MGIPGIEPGPFWVSCVKDKCLTECYHFGPQTQVLRIRNKKLGSCTKGLEGILCFPRCSACFSLWIIPEHFWKQILTAVGIDPKYQALPKRPFLFIWGHTSYCLGLMPGSTLIDHSWRCLEDNTWCWGSNPGWPHWRQAPYHCSIAIALAPKTENFVYERDTTE